MVLTSLCNCWFFATLCYVTSLWQSLAMLDRVRCMQSGYLRLSSMLALYWRKIFMTFKRRNKKYTFFVHCLILNFCLSRYPYRAHDEAKCSWCRWPMDWRRTAVGWAWFCSSKTFVPGDVCSSLLRRWLRGPLQAQGWQLRALHLLECWRDRVQSRLDRRLLLEA